MNTNHVSVFHRTLQKSEAWVGEMHKDLDWMEADSVYHILRAVLQSIRDQLNVNEVTQLAAQLPLLLRGTFYESWNPKVKPQRKFTKEEFLQDVKTKMGPIGELTFDLEKGVASAIRVLSSHVSAGEMEDVLSSQTPSLKKFFQNINKEGA